VAEFNLSLPGAVSPIAGQLGSWNFAYSNVSWHKRNSSSSNWTL